MRFIIGILLTVFVLAVFRTLMHEIQNAVGKALRGDDADEPAEPKNRGKQRDRNAQAGRLVKDPVSGVYIDESTAVKADVNGQTYFFESRKNRDAFLKEQTA